MKAKRFLAMLLTGCLAVLTLFSFVGCGELSGYNKNEKMIYLTGIQVGSTFDVQIKSYSGTAYRWDYEIDSNVGVEYVSSEFIPTNGSSDWAGGGLIAYTFKALTVGEYKIKFCAEDITQQKSTPIETIIYVVTIENM